MRCDRCGLRQAAAVRLTFADGRARAQDNASPLHVAAGSCNAGSADIIYVLHQLGSEQPALRRLLAVDVLDAHGKTPLHVAVEAGNVPAIEALIELGANIEQVCVGPAAVCSGP